MQFNLSVLIHHVSVWSFFGRLKSRGFSFVCKTPKIGLVCKKLVVIECLNFEKAIRLKFADKYQTAAPYGSLKVEICQKRRYLRFPYIVKPQIYVIRTLKVNNYARRNVKHKKGIQELFTKLQQLNSHAVNSQSINIVVMLLLKNLQFTDLLTYRLCYTQYQPRKYPTKQWRKCN